MSNLKRIRESKDLTQAKLADLAKVSRRMVEYYEQGYHDINKAEAFTVYKLAKALKCRMEALLELESESED